MCAAPSRPCPIQRLTIAQVSEHALNSVFAASELVLARTATPPMLHLPFLILILARLPRRRVHYARH